MVFYILELLLWYVTEGIWFGSMCCFLLLHSRVFVNPITLDGFNVGRDYHDG